MLADAALLLALREQDNQRFVPVVRQGAVDADPLIRLRALAVATSFQDPLLRGQLRSLFRGDPELIVRRAFERSSG